MDYRQEIREFIGNNLTMDHEDTPINDDDNYFELRFVNSLFAMRLVDFVERRFQIEIGNEDLDLSNFCTINRLQDLIERKLTAKGAAI
ncbi:acyl carrier protein [Chryseobacterium mucoviscidosis]|uniref:acyl carrier protein n=1 Tax=unclassified Paenibacillus TaxID=185978 RepID=UPI0009A40F08|nr:acyl carrier protein [Paenibacillus sp. 11B]MDN8588536.1 acyl carrier protein [Paenibacillus sp. 11B]OPG94377.1 acyl carrier protein [Chryseobacterium mucoviscidosis]